MKVAVTDANIFIDLIELQIHTHFFGLSLDIHTTVDVFNELYPEQQNILSIYKSVGKLTIHTLSSEDHLKIMTTPFPKSLSAEDKSVIFLAQRLGALLLSSDKPVRNHAKSISVEYHGMLWIFDKLIEECLLECKDAISMINKLVNSNIIYRNNLELQAEVDKRIKIWSKN